MTQRQQLINMAMVLATVVVVLSLVIGETFAQGEIKVAYRVMENTPSNTYIGSVPQDAELDQKYDESTFNSFAYSFLNNKYEDYFSLDSKGVLRTGAPIDRETLCPQSQGPCEIDFSIVVQPVSYFQIIIIAVTVEDANDKAPMFLEARISLTVPENTEPGASFTLPTADDEDSPRNGIKSYTMKSGGPTFGLRVVNNTDNTFDLFLVLKQSVDREVREFYQMIIEASDGDNTPGQLIVDIEILDVNDNLPTFQNQTYEVTVLENVEKMIPILQVRATDNDDGINGQIIYGFSTKTERSYGALFGIDSSTGEIYPKTELNYEEETMYNLVVTAKDKNPESLSVNAKVIIHIRDVNDHAPKITVNALTSTGRVEISEASPVGSFVAHISVKDLDSGANGNFTCTLNSDMFELQQMYTVEYKLITKQLMDREIRAEYSLTLNCKDKGVPLSLSSNAVINVGILDENDHEPVFTKQTYSAIIEEGNMVGVKIVQVNATDADQGQNGAVEYRMNTGDALEYVSIDQNTGQVTTARVFDFELDKNLEFQIIAVDRGVDPKSSTATLLITIIDVNDEPPKFNLPRHRFGVFENSDPNTEVGQVEAVDADSEPYNQFEYAIKLDPTARGYGLFKINPSNGKIMTTQTLDRETSPSYEILVLAINQKEPPMTGTTTVEVYLADRNDNPPEISFPTAANNTVHISNQSPLGYAFTRIAATDKDMGANAKMQFIITKGNEEEFFILGEWDGVISVNAPLSSFENRVFQLDISITDGGFPQKMTETSLNVVVNKSIIFPGKQQQNHPPHNVTIVIAVVIVTVILVVILTLAIYLLRRQDTRDRKSRHMSQLLADQKQKAIVDQEKERSNSLMYGQKSRNGLRHGPDGSDTHISLDMTSQWPAHSDGLLAESTPTKPHKMSSLQLNPKVSVKKQQCRPKAQNEPLIQGTGTLYDTPNSTMKSFGHYIPSQFTEQGKIKEEKNLDRLDTESNHSLEHTERLSNADSGRGSNEDGTENRNSTDLDNSMQHRELSTFGTPNRPTHHPASYNTNRDGQPFKRQLNSVVQMHSDHAQDNLKHNKRDNTRQSQRAIHPVPPPPPPPSQSHLHPQYMQNHNNHSHHPLQNLDETDRSRVLSPQNHDSGVLYMNNSLNRPKRTNHTEKPFQITSSHV